MIPESGVLYNSLPSLCRKLNPYSSSKAPRFHGGALHTSRTQIFKASGPRRIKYVVGWVVSLIRESVATASIVNASEVQQKRWERKGRWTSADDGKRPTDWPSVNRSSTFVKGIRLSRHLGKSQEASWKHFSSSIREQLPQLTKDWTYTCNKSLRPLPKATTLITAWTGHRTKIIKTIDGDDNKIQF